ncbi:LacI family DNA-binding transcriptional regulator [Nonomuraea sp. NPDC050404]|uniref:LacI family DNA-binding transcriptional regulator n=1 Tax=Nonomuraea sp. NPDC050404 TaxID=3155783 RepID=UPI0033E0AEF3
MVTKSEDVARAAGVSRATVSQILNGRGARFSEETRARVLQTAEEMGYRPSIAGRALATGASDIVVALLPYTHLGGNLQAVLEQATEELSRHGLTLLLRLTTRNPTSLEQLVTQLRPRAVFALWPFTADERAVLERQGVAAISPGELDDGFDRRIGRAQAEHLAAKGYRRLAYVHLEDERFRIWGPPREQGVVEVCAELGLPAPVVLRPRLDQREVLDVLDALPPGSGVACYNDDLAIALMQAAAVRGLSVPGDLGIIGMDDTPLAAVTHPRLATVSVDVSAAALRATRQLLAGLDIPAGLADVRQVGPQVIPGESA